MKNSTKKIVIAGLVFLGIFLVGNWWLYMPQRTVGKFVSLASTGQYQEIESLLIAPSALQETEDGDLLVHDRNGNTHRVASQRLPLLSGQVTQTPLPPGRWSDFLVGRKSFAMAATGAGKALPREGTPVTLFFSVASGGVHIETLQ
ncbi:MAG: hypothetical protein GY759_12870 [Chloroflexi bacterium]|nr:hypothetical protein [Chloroflexota bacterium]